MSAVIELEPAEATLSPAGEEAVREALSHYPNQRSAILPVLWIIQREHGWLSPGGLRLAARLVDLPQPEVFGIATFYTMFNLKPVGRHHLQVCMTLSCSLMGADRLFRHLEKKLGVDFRPYVILGACNPPLAHQAIESDPDIGLLLPCNVVVREEADGRIWVGFMDPEAVLRLVDRPEVHALGREVRKKLERVQNSLT